MISFVKMQGIGNDFVVLDALLSPLPDDLPSVAKRLCDRRFGVGGDGILTLERGETAPFKMRMFNPDGSESEMCGNGIRCVGALIKLRDYATEAASYAIETGAGTLIVEALNDDLYRVDMGNYSLAPADLHLTWEGDKFVNELVSKSLRGTAVSMGNPHLVIFTSDVAAIELDHVGPILEAHPWFRERTNVHFVEAVSRTHLKQRTWERGAGITLACGTGACACAVAAHLNDLADPSVDIDLPGGRLHIEVQEDARVYMTGPAVTVFSGEPPDDLGL